MSSLACRQPHNDSNVDPARSQAATIENGHIVCVFVYLCMYRCGGVHECLNTRTCVYIWKPGDKLGISLRVAP